MPDAASFINVPDGETRPPDTCGVAPRNADRTGTTSHVNDQVNKRRLS